MAEKFFRWGAAEGRIFLGSGRGDGFLGVVLSVAQRLRTRDCARSKAVMGMGAGGGRPSHLEGPGVLPPEILFLFLSVRMCIFEC